MANIQNIRGMDNPSRAYEWEVSIEAPSAVGNLEVLVERAQNVSVPETSIETIEIPYKSRTSYFAGRDSSGHTVDIEFFDDESHQVYRYFKNWIESISSSREGGGVTRDEYGAKMIIKQLSHNSTDTTITHELTKVFPTSVGEISLDYSASEHTTFTVTMSFEANLVQDAG